MITADTITDEQIRELHALGLITTEQAADSLSLSHVRSRYESKAEYHARLSDRDRTRASCAKILNARATSKHWPDCAMNHGGSACDMGPECGTEDAASKGGES